MGAGTKQGGNGQGGPATMPLMPSTSMGQSANAPMGSSVGQSQLARLQALNAATRGMARRPSPPPKAPKEIMDMFLQQYYGGSPPGESADGGGASWDSASNAANDTGGL